MKQCPKCNAQIDDNVTFCPYCGFNVAPMADPFDHTAEFEAKDVSDNKVYAMLTYLTGVVGIIIALLAAKDSKYLAFHVRQVVKIQVSMLLCVVGMIIPFLGWIAGVGGICVLSVIEIICFFRVCSGKSVEPPIVRSFGFMK